MNIGRRQKIDLEWPYKMQPHPTDPDKLGTQEMLEKVLSPGAPYKRIGFGGPKGGGKSYSARGISFTLTYFLPIVVVLIRSRLTTLKRNHILPAKNELRDFLEQDIVSYNEKDKIFYMPSGGMVQYMHCATEKDIDQFDGVAADLYIFEEAGQFNKVMIDGIIKNNRSSDIAINRQASYKPRSLFTFNWGGPGHATLRRWFWDEVYLENEKPEHYFFIFADIQQNQALLKSNPEYLDNLRSLPTQLRRAYLTGDPDAMVGTVFMIVPKAHYVSVTDICEKVEYSQSGRIDWIVPRDWRIVGSLDAGRGAPTSFGLYGIPPHKSDDRGEKAESLEDLKAKGGNLIKLFNYYYDPEKEDGYKRDPIEHVEAIMKEIKEFPFTEGRLPEFIVGDSYAFQEQSVQSGDVTWEDLFAIEGIPMYQVKYKRQTALFAMHTALHFEFDEKNDDLVVTPKLQFLEGYNDPTIEELRAIQASRENPDDIEKNSVDHALDETKNMVLCAESLPEYVPLKEPKKVDRKADYGSAVDKLERFVDGLRRSLGTSYRDAI